MSILRIAALLLVTTFLSSCSENTSNKGQAATQDQPAATNSDSPNLVLINGRIYTANPSNPKAEAVAILDNRILAIGTSEEISALAGPDTSKVDLKQHFVIPGLNDAHYHTFSSLTFGHQLQLPWEPSWAQVLAAVEAATKAVPEGTWIITGLVGVDVVDDESADRFSLDAVSPDHPVYISSWFSHGEIINTQAMRVLEVDENEPDPVGGWFVRVPGSDKITGKLHEYAQWPLRRRLVDIMLSDDEMRAMLQAESAKLVRYGVTSIQDMPILDPARYLRVLDQAKLPIRVRFMRIPITTPEGRNVDEAFDVPKHPFGNRLITATGTKWFLDGTPIERWAATRKDYLDRPGWRGKLAFPEAEIDEILSNPDEWKGQVLFHTEGDRSVEVLLNSMERVQNPDWPGKRVRIEHGEGLFGNLIPRAARLGTVVVQQPQHLVLAEMYQYRVADSAQWFPLKSLIEAGIPLAMGTEGIESPYAAFPYALNHPLNAKESLTREQVIDGFTRVAAFAEFEENQKGQIAKGMLADIAVLTQDLLTAPADKLAETQSILTIVDGKIAYDAGVLN